VSCPGRSTARLGPLRLSPGCDSEILVRYLPGSVQHNQQAHRPRDRAARLIAAAAALRYTEAPPERALIFGERPAVAKNVVQIELNRFDLA